MQNDCVSPGVSDNRGGKQYDKLELLALRYAVTDDVSLLPDLEWLQQETSQYENTKNRRSNRRRARGKRSGVKVRTRNRGTRPALPTVFYGNVRSVRNKMDELAANCKYNQEYRDISLICLTETWLDCRDSDGSVNIDGFNLVRADRKGTRKQHGGGIGVYINEHWCKNVTIKKCYCDDNVEYLILSCRPFYMPREFNNIYVTVVYVPPSANANEAAEIISNCASYMDDNCPDGVNLLMGDFNRLDVNDHIPNYHQYVHCNTRGDHTLDLFFCNIPNAYKVLSRSPLGISDHCMLYCIPTYIQKLKSHKPHTIRVRQWDNSSIETLKACFDCTCWNVLYDNDDELEHNVDVITSYITFCTDMLVPTKSVNVYPNNKPWVTKELKEVINKKKRALSNNREDLKSVQKELNSKIHIAKTAYKQKVEDLFKSQKSKDAWKALKFLSGHVKKNCMPEP